MTMEGLYTIGHSNHEMEAFLCLLKDFSVQVVVDVRSAPYSRYVPQYNKRELEQALIGHGFQYIFMGDAIGGKPSDPALHDDQGRVQYDKLAQTAQFQKGIDRLEKGLVAGWRIALLCAEEDPEKCHRHWLIAKELEWSRKIAVWHLRADGRKVRAKELLAGTCSQLNLFAK